MGLWIDLTNTKRFYDRRDVETRDCRYMKMQCRGHGETPNEEQTRAFIEIVDEYITENPMQVIGVHCTHGFNRTGFLIVSYMVEKMDCSVEAALAAFAHSRPPGIYKADYIKELFRRYDDEDDAPPPPELPAWCYEEEEDDEPQYDQNYQHNQSFGEKRQHGDDDDEIENNGECSTSSNGENVPKKKRKKEFLNLNATFMAGVPGVELVTDQPRVSELQATVQDYCKWKGTGFPGSQPVSMDKENINFLHQKPYRVSWKADGTRYMMLIQKENEVFFFDRDNSVFQVEGLRFPLRSDLNRHLENTLIDGVSEISSLFDNVINDSIFTIDIDIEIIYFQEMVIDKVNGLSVPRFLVYDILRYMDEDYMERPFYPDRLQCIKANIVG